MRKQIDSPVYSDPIWPRAAHAGEQRTRVPYQAALRAVGAYLDQRDAKRINLLEDTSGFAVRFQPQPDQPECVMVRLDNSQLLSLSSELERKRRRTIRLRSGEKVRMSYENVLRALGHEFDMLDAYTVLVDEFDGGMVVTYQYLNPSEGFNAQKRMVILGPEAMQSVLDSAEARREQRKQGLLTLLAG